MKSIPVSIITGFLGAGKSTLLNRLLKDRQLSDCAVIINEFGDVGIDHMLVETSGDQMVELSDGCLCCTVRGELVDTLASFIDLMQTGKMKPISRVVIETTGLADPVPVLQSVIGNPVLAQNFHLDGVVTVIDALNGMRSLDNHEEARRQAAVADRLVISKTAMAEPSEVNVLAARLMAINPNARILDADGDEAGTARLLEAGYFDVTAKSPDVARWLAHEDKARDHHHDDHGHHDHGHHHHDGQDHHAHDHDHAPHAHGHHHHSHDDVNRHDASIRSFSIVHDQPIDRNAVAMFVDLLRSAHGEKLLRMKAIVMLSDDPSRPLVLHAAQSTLHPPARLDAWPGEDRRTRLVLITKDLEEDFVRDLFDAFIGKPRVGGADRAALTDNPLAVPGMKF
ncbi:CobW family GTP-binding protein [Rhizobium sp. C4]|uniref:CobW family GTP-binding protein n=1 Tax=Rhizobium sp. C4 TaxID=1349800 RepID=UPI001E6337D1|nr:GTP-binding protein [Rhizobium sp. C4]MCD2175681.1 GTP-binding protein [Rhizobium sp. C4]